jgi:hypothetical protein
MISVFRLSGGGKDRRSNHTPAMFSVYQSPKVIPAIELSSTSALAHSVFFKL